jgi:hypothetical protein
MPEMVHERALIEKELGHRASKREDSNLDNVLARINLFAVSSCKLSWQYVYMKLNRSRWNPMRASANQ